MLLLHLQLHKLIAALTLLHLPFPHWADQEMPGNKMNNSLSCPQHHSHNERVAQLLWGWKEEHLCTFGFPHMLRYWLSDYWNDSKTRFSVAHSNSKQKNKKTTMNSVCSCTVSSFLVGCNVSPIGQLLSIAINFQTIWGHFKITIYERQFL